jgi:hypothetical protein
MSNFNIKNEEFFVLKIIQSGEIKSFSLSEENLNKTFKELYLPIIKELKLKKKDIFLSNDAGKALTSLDLNLSLKEILEKFGNKINLYYEKIM